jgi:hypothetical protein
MPLLREVRQLILPTCRSPVILVFGTLPSATAPLRPAFSSTSSAKPRRSSNPRRRAFPKSLKAPQPPSSRGAVHVALEAASSTSAGSPPKMPSDHDPLLPLPGSIVILARVLQTPQPPSDPRPDQLLPMFSIINAQPTFVAQPASRQNPSPSIRDSLGKNLIAPLSAQLKIPYPAEPPGATHPASVQPSFCVGKWPQKLLSRYIAFGLRPVTMQSPPVGLLESSAEVPLRRPSKTSPNLTITQFAHVTLRFIEAYQLEGTARPR